MSVITACTYLLKVNNRNTRTTPLANLSKKRLWRKCFPVNFVKYLSTPFLIEHLRCLLPYRVELTQIHNGAYPN